MGCPKGEGGQPYKYIKTFGYFMTLDKEGKILQDIVEPVRSVPKLGSGMLLF